MNIDKINELLDKEIEFAKGCGMPQFVMGITQAKKVLNDYKSAEKMDKMCPCNSMKSLNSGMKCSNCGREL